MLIDTHAHLYWDSFKDNLDQVLKRMADNKVTTIINVGTDTETSRKALNQISSPLFKISNLKAYSSIGIHPHDAIKYYEDTENSIQKDIDILEGIYTSNPKKVVAIGECGLDFFFTNHPDFIPASNKSKVIKETALDYGKIKDLQKKLLHSQIELAKKLNLPLLIHCRDAWGEIWELIEDHFGILHCYSGDINITKKVLTSNFLVSFAATITYPKNDFLREAALILPIEKIILETDSPFLPPQSKRGQRNEPANVKEVAELIAQLKNMPFEEVAEKTAFNATTLLKLS